MLSRITMAIQNAIPIPHFIGDEIGGNSFFPKKSFFCTRKITIDTTAWTTEIIKPMTTKIFNQIGLPNPSNGKKYPLENK